MKRPTDNEMDQAKGEMSEPIAISEEARKAAEAELSAAYTRRHIAAHEENEKGFACQIAINSATAPLQKRIEELEKHLLAMREALYPLCSGVDVLNWGKIKAHLPVDLAKELTSFNYAADKAVATIPSDLSRKYVKREVLERGVEFATLVDKEAVQYLKDSGLSTEAINLHGFCFKFINDARKELEK